jgi:hypothetical protein
MSLSIFLICGERLFGRPSGRIRFKASLKQAKAVFHVADTLSDAADASAVIAAQNSIQAVAEVLYALADFTDALPDAAQVLAVDVGANFTHTFDNVAQAFDEYRRRPCGPVGFPGYTGTVAGYFQAVARIVDAILNIA